MKRHEGEEYREKHKTDGHGECKLDKPTPNMEKREKKRSG